MSNETAPPRMIDQSNVIRFLSSNRTRTFMSDALTLATHRVKAEAARARIGRQSRIGSIATKGQLDHIVPLGGYVEAKEAIDPADTVA